MNRPRLIPVLAPLFVVGFLACAESPDFLAPDESSPEGSAGSGGSAGASAGSAGAGNQGGAGSGAGQSGAGGSNAGAGPGAGTAGAGGNETAGSGGSGGGGGGTSGANNGTGGDGGSPFGGSTGQAGQSAGGASQGGTGQGGAGQGGAGQGGAGQGGEQGGAAGTDIFGGSGGQPFGGMNTSKNCAPLPGGNGGTGVAESGIPGGFCASDKLGNPNDDPCYTCWNGSRSGQCKAQFDDCDASPDCLKFADCWSSCKNDEDKCFKTCTGLFPGGAEPYHQIRNCIYIDACPSVCAEQCQGIGSANRCNHDVCTSGYDLDPDCSPCAGQVCESDSTCCAFEWDNFCVGKAESICKLDCSNPPLPGCVHSECATGAPLKAGCSACADKVCAKYPLCCAGYGRWDVACAAAADEMCTP